MGDRIQKIYDAVNAILKNTEVAILTGWASFGVICLALFGFISLGMVIYWVWKRPPMKELAKNLVYMFVVGLALLIFTAVPAGLISAIPGAGSLVSDLVNAIIGPASQDETAILLLVAYR